MLPLYFPLDHYQVTPALRTINVNGSDHRTHDPNRDHRQLYTDSL